MSGNFEYVKNLKEVQFKTYPKNTILICEFVGGNEEIPENVDCLIITNSNDYPDILAHVSVRARNLGIPFMICFEDEVTDELKKLVGKRGTIKFYSGENVDFSLEEKVDEQNFDDKFKSKYFLRNFLLKNIF